MWPSGQQILTKPFTNISYLSIVFISVGRTPTIDCRFGNSFQGSCSYRAYNTVDGWSLDSRGMLCSLFDLFTCGLVVVLLPSMWDVVDLIVGQSKPLILNLIFSASLQGTQYAGVIGSISIRSINASKKCGLLVCHLKV